MIIPDYFEFYNKTKINAGNKALETIPFDLESMNAFKPLVITDKKSSGSGIAGALVKAFYESGITIGAVYDELPGYVSLRMLMDLSGLFRERGCDSVIAVGGDAAASAAKGLNILLSDKAGDIAAFDSMEKSALLKPFIYVPSLAACGTETSNEVIIDSRLYKSDSLFPDLVVIDKRMFAENGKADTASSAMLALVQAIEACRADLSNPVNDSFAYTSIELVYENLSDALKCCGKKMEKTGFVNGVAISGIVYSNAPEGIARAIGFEMEKMTGYSAGLCAGLVLPYALDYKLRFEKTGLREELLLPLAGIDNYCSVKESERAEKSIELLYLMIDNLEGVIPGRIKELNIPMYMIRKIAESAEGRVEGRYGKGAALKILEHAYDGIPFKGGKTK